MRSNNTKLISLCALSLGMIFFAGCSEENSNYRAAGTGTYDNANNFNAPGNEVKLVEALSKMIANPIPAKSLMSIGRLERLGATAEAALPSLEKVSKEHADQGVQEAAQKAIDAIKADMAAGATEQTNE